MILIVTLTNVETKERRSIEVEGQSRKGINSTARRELDCPWPAWEATYEVVRKTAIKSSRPKKPQPSLVELAERRVCPECGDPVERRSARGPFPTFCPDKNCKKTRGNRRLVRGAAVIEFLQAWRATRSQGETAKRSFMEMCRIADQFNAEDHAANRPRADLCAAKILADGTMYSDRQKKDGPRRRKAPVDQPELALVAPAPDLALLRAKVEDESTTDNERAVLAAALEILTAKAA